MLAQLIYGTKNWFYEKKSNFFPKHFLNFFQFFGHPSHKQDQRTIDVIVIRLQWLLMTLLLQNVLLVCTLLYFFYIWGDSKWPIRYEIVCDMDQSQWVILNLLTNKQDQKSIDAIHGKGVQWLLKVAKARWW